MNTILVHNDVEQKFLEAIFASPVSHPAGIEAREAAYTLRFPHRKMESWKYTRVAKLLNASFNQEATQGGKHAKVQNGNVVILDNGVFFNAQSRLPQITGVKVLPMSKALELGVLDDLLSDISYDEGDVFKALNVGSIADGLYIETAKDADLSEGLRVLVSMHSKSVSQPLIVIRAAENSCVRISFEVRSADDTTCFCNAVLLGEVADGAQLAIEQVILANEASFVVTDETINQDHNSTVTINAICLGSAINRNTLRINSNGSGTETNLNGLYFPNGNQHIDNATCVDHRFAHANSNEKYKGLAAGKGTGVFNGKVFVREDAQKINAFQSNNNLLLSAEATLNSKPELEIYADDVKCSHGSTTGQLNPSHLFYLKARGIGDEEAKKLLIAAFAGEVIDEMMIPALKMEVEQLITEKVAKLE